MPERSFREADLFNLSHISKVVSIQQQVGKTAGSTEFVTIDDIISDAVQMTVSSVARRGVKLDVETAGIPPVALDRHRILQILINLITNACHALEDVKIEKSIHVRINKIDKSMAQIEIVDNGMGISPENMDKLFTYGFTTKDSGHGFGLHHCRTIVSEIGGDLTAYSEGAGCGATFTLTLPLGIKEGGG